MPRLTWDWRLTGRNVDWERGDGTAALHVQNFVTAPRCVGGQPWRQELRGEVFRGEGLLRAMNSPWFSKSKQISREEGRGVTC